MVGRYLQVLLLSMPLMTRCWWIDDEEEEAAAAELVPVEDRPSIRLLEPPGLGATANGRSCSDSGRGGKEGHEW